MSKHAGRFVIAGKLYEGSDSSLEKMVADNVQVSCMDCEDFNIKVTAQEGEYNVLPAAKGELAKHQHDAWVKEVDSDRQG